MSTRYVNTLMIATIMDLMTMNGALDFSEKENEDRELLELAEPLAALVAGHPQRPAVGALVARRRERGERGERVGGAPARLALPRRSIRRRGKGFPWGPPFKKKRNKQ